jgi:hypothetical protein
LCLWDITEDVLKPALPLRARLSTSKLSRVSTTANDITGIPPLALSTSAADDAAFTPPASAATTTIMNSAGKSKDVVDSSVGKTTKRSFMLGRKKAPPPAVTASESTKDDLRTADETGLFVDQCTQILLDQSVPKDASNSSSKRLHKRGFSMGKLGSSVPSTTQAATTTSSAGTTPGRDKVGGIVQTPTTADPPSKTTDRGAVRPVADDVQRMLGTPACPRLDEVGCRVDMVYIFLYTCRYP